MIRLLCLLALAACADHGPATPVPCGSASCNGAQYCAQVCTCCGIDGGIPSGYDECRATPGPCADLEGDALRDCLSTQTGGDALEQARVVAFPCE